MKQKRERNIRTLQITKYISNEHSQNTQCLNPVHDLATGKGHKQQNTTRSDLIKGQDYHYQVKKKKKKKTTCTGSVPVEQVCYKVVHSDSVLVSLRSGAHRAVSLQGSGTATVQPNAFVTRTTTPLQRKYGQMLSDRDSQHRHGDVCEWTLQTSP